jgi:hypothetical protein
MDPLYCFKDTLQELRKEKSCVRTYSNRPTGFVSADVYCRETASQLCAQEVRRSIAINITVKKSLHLQEFSKSLATILKT